MTEQYMQRQFYFLLKKGNRPILWLWPSIMLPVISPQWCLSSQLPPRQPALPPPLPCYSGQANPQLSHMPCLLDVWTKLGGSEAKRNLLIESDAVGRDGCKCLPFWFPEEPRLKTNGVWLPYFLKVLVVSCWRCGTRGGSGVDVRCRAVQRSVSPVQWKKLLNTPPPHTIQSQPEHTTQRALLMPQSACSHGGDPVSNWSIEVSMHRLVWQRRLTVRSPSLATLPTYVHACAGEKLNTISWGIKWIITEKQEIAWIINATITAYKHSHLSNHPAVGMST